MRKLGILGLVLVLLCSYSIAAWGSTIGVNVSEGASVSLEKENFDQDAMKLTANFGVSDKLLLWSAYSTATEENSDDATLYLGMRYKFAKDFAGIFEYRHQEKLDELDFGARVKEKLTKPLAVVGEAKFLDFIPNEGDSYTGFSLKAQLQYTFSRLVIGNFGIATSDTEKKGSEGVTKILTGLELYPAEQFTWWIDYSRDLNQDKNIVGAGVEYKF